MSDKSRNFLAILMLALLATSAFVAGYFANDFIEMGSGGGRLAQDRQKFGVFWEAWGRIQANFLGELPDSTQLTYSAIRGVVSELNDPYTVFVEPILHKQDQESLRGKFGGIGATLSRPDPGGAVILDPIPGNPAEVAGILKGDVLVAVDDVTITAEMTVHDIVNLIRGETGTPVTLTVLHEGNDHPITVTIERSEILLPSVTFRILKEDPNIGYIQLSRFSGESANEVKNAITSLQAQGATQLILDMRQNGGGLLDAAVNVADLFLTDGVILYQKTRGQQVELTFSARAETAAPNEPLVVLVDRGTASAAEIVAGALQDRERAVLIGNDQTFGKGSVQMVFDLEDGSSVHVTSARWFTPDRRQIDQQGLQPDIWVTVSQEAIDNGLDEVLEQAVAYFQNGSESTLSR
ncbi:MAG: S41 family peptidase [Anaerolineae bacterium]